MGILSENGLVESDVSRGRVTNNSLRMEIEAVAAALGWLSDTSVTRTSILFDHGHLDSCFEGCIMCGFGLSGCQKTSNIQEVAWVYCSGHVGVRGNERAGSLASSHPSQG